MLDVKFVVENPELIKKDLKKRGKEFKLENLKAILEFYPKWKKVKQELDDLRNKRNIISENINKLKKEGKDISPLIKEIKEIPERIKVLELEEVDLKDKVDFNLNKLPNLLDQSVPIGKSDKDNKEIKKWGKIPKIKFELKNHAELLEKLGFADFEAGINNAGRGFNYLLKDVALLDMALQRYGVDFLIKNKFIPVVPPMLLNHKTLLSVLSGLEDFENVIYKVENEDLYLIGTGEHPLVSLFKNKTLVKENLPTKLFTVTPCFRKEVGGHGIDTKWLFRMHQFNKVEQVVFCTPKDSIKMHKYMQALTEKFFQSLKIPYRVIEICSGDLGAKFAKQWDIEAWFPRQKEYKEVTSAGNCTDFQARALNIKYSYGKEKGYVHILNNTMVATSRAMVAILENYQQKDGTIKVPRVLIPYMHGIKVIGKKH